MPWRTREGNDDPLPVEVVEVYPEWRGYGYIRVGGAILILDPGTHEIVAIIDA